MRGTKPFIDAKALVQVWIVHQALPAHNSTGLLKVTSQILPRACSRECFSEHIHNAHLQLTPRMGDRQ
jgi:hypothetical protein